VNTNGWWLRAGTAISLSTPLEVEDCGWLAGESDVRAAAFLALRRASTSA